MAVVVQLMVPSDVSGILFTANPATGDRSEILINASFGLGEAVVGGQVTPDTFVVDRGTLTAKETSIGTKEQQIVSDGDQGTSDWRTSPKMSAVGLLCRKTPSRSWHHSRSKVEKHFDGVPQDIEWAYSANGKLCTCCNLDPITSLPPQPIQDIMGTNASRQVHGPAPDCREYAGSGLPLVRRSSI